MPNMLLEINREITPERMKRWSQKKHKNNQEFQNQTIILQILQATFEAEAEDAILSWSKEG